MNKQVHTPFTPADSPSDTALSAAFVALLPILSAYIRAERNLEDIGYSLDPAYSEWHRESEAAQDRLIDLLHDLRTVPLGIAMDAPLRKVALMIHAMRCDPLEARALHRKTNAAFETRFRVPGIGPMAQHRRLLLAWCRPLLASFAALPLFDPAPEDDTGSMPTI